MEKIQETIIFKEEIDEDYRNDYSQTIEADLVRDIKRLSLPVKLRIFLSEDNSYILLIDPSVKYHGIRNGNKLLVKVKSVDELVYLTEKIILNIEKCKLEQSEVYIDSEKSEDLSFKKFFKPKDPSLAKRTLSKELDFILTKPDEILIDGKKLEPYRVVADELVDKANISKDSSKKVVDFNKNVSYDRYTQDILIHHILGKNIKKVGVK